MKVFLSWSKPRSKAVAELLAEWIPCVIQAVEPWVSSQNIEDGELWFNAIQSQVAQIINGIICLTHENKAEPWILFEAGGLAKGLEKTRIFILLIDLSNNDILLSPLAGFNHTTVSEDGIRKLMHVINGRTARPVSPSVINQVFDKFWPDFDFRFKEILDQTKPNVEPIIKDSLSKDIDSELKPLLEEILKTVRQNEDKPRGMLKIKRTIIDPKLSISVPVFYESELKNHYIKIIEDYQHINNIGNKRISSYKDELVALILDRMTNIDEALLDDILLNSRVTI